MTTEGRVSRLEGVIEEMQNSISSIRSDLQDLRNELRALNNRFFWLFGFLGAMWVTIILAVLFGN